MEKTYRFCPHCGAPLAEGEKFGRMRQYCRYCRFIHFIEPKVAVAAAVHDRDRILLVRRKFIPRIGYWALPAGYMDADEMPENALVREVAEETGVTVRVVRLQSIAPLAGWKDPRGILLVYLAEPIGGEAQAGDDVSDARWFARDEVPWDELAFESTSEYVASWAKR